MDSPNPRPECPRVAGAEACEKRSKTCGRNSGAMPTPSSATLITRLSSLISRPTFTTLRALENLMALETRFHRICWNRVTSIQAMMSSDGASNCRVMFLSAALSRNGSRLCTANEQTLTSSRCRLSFPVVRSEEHTSELQSQSNLVCRLLLEKKKKDAGKSQAPPRTPVELQALSAIAR